MGFRFWASDWGLFASLRPVRVLSILVDSTDPRPEVVKGVDSAVVREIAGGFYFSQPKK
jgi:3-isopropylmalate dehydrogenase